MSDLKLDLTEVVGIVADPTGPTVSIVSESVTVEVPEPAPEVLESAPPINEAGPAEENTEG